MAQVYFCLLNQLRLIPGCGALGWMQAPHQTGSWRFGGGMAEDTPTGEPLLILRELCVPQLCCYMGPRPDRWQL